MAQILEGLNEDNSWPLDCLHEETEPVILSFVKEEEGWEDDSGCKDDEELHKPEDMDKGILKTGPHIVLKRFEVDRLDLLSELFFPFFLLFLIEVARHEGVVG